VSACFACSCGAFLHTIIPTLKLLSFDHHRIPILVNPINNGLEAFDHLIVVPGLARLCQHTGVTPRLSNRALPQDKADNSNMELNSWPHVRSNLPQTNFRRLQLILLSVNFFFTIPSHSSATLSVPVDGRLINARVQQDPLSIRPVSPTRIFFVASRDFTPRIVSRWKKTLTPCIAPDFSVTCPLMAFGGLFACPATV
jgi:hypothetical protein